MRVLVFSFLAFAAPAALVAQETAPRTTQRELVIFGDDKCPADTLCVVAPESERYRIPKQLRKTRKTPASQAWAVQNEALMDAGKSGIGSCSASGHMAWTGCWAEEMRRARREREAEDRERDDVP